MELSWRKGRGGKRGEEEKGNEKEEKKIIIPLFSSHSSLFCLRPCSLKKRGETNTRPDTKRACCVPRAFKVAGKLGTRSSEKSLVTTAIFHPSDLLSFVVANSSLRPVRVSLLSSHRFIMPIIEACDSHEGGI